MMKKRSSFDVLPFQQKLPTLADLAAKIQMDYQLSQSEKSQALQELAEILKSHALTTPVSEIMHKIIGGILGVLISRYFGMGLLGQIAAGYLGARLADIRRKRQEERNNPYRGWKNLLKS